MDISNTSVIRAPFKQKILHERLRFFFTPRAHSLDGFANSVRLGLTSKRKFLQPQYFYDGKGSKLFAQICQQPEYYLTRVETSILESCAPGIAEICHEAMLVELGSGNSSKTQKIFDSLLEKQETLHYFPVDISYEALERGSKALLSEYERLVITALVAEYEEGIHVIKRDVNGKKLIIFLGSTIGNFDPLDAKRFATMVRNSLKDDDMFLLGLDLHKDKTVLEAAYNDAAGVTAQFNLNILERINRELGGDFGAENFKHHAFYNEAKRRIEMHLVSKLDQVANVKAIGEEILLKKGESIHTENSYKFTTKDIETMVEGNFQIMKMWTDKERWYNVILLAPLS